MVKGYFKVTKICLSSIMRERFKKKSGQAIKDGWQYTLS